MRVVKKSKRHSLSARGSAYPEFRIGQGMDVHPFVKGRPFVLGGVTIPHTHGLKGHSDADALLHAIVDAILGASGGSDIGVLFPDSDKKWRGAPSTLFLTKVWQSVRKQRWQVVNVDCTVLAELPKLSPHVPKMRALIGKILGVPASRIAIKATTTEKMGFVGRKEGILASAVVLLQRAA